MKTKMIFSRLLVIAGMFFVFVFSSKAESNEGVRVILLNRNRILMLINNPEKQRVSLNITEIKSNNILWSGNTNRDRVYNAEFDLSNLPDGEYRMSVEFNNRAIIKEIELNDNTSELTGESTYVTPEFTERDKVLTVKYHNPSEKDVEIEFLSGLNSFFTDKLPENIGSFKRSYDLKNLIPGSYSVMLSSGDRNYFYSLNIP